MDITTFVMYFGFILAAYSVIGNDTIQTLGTFLSSNEDKSWFHLWLYAGSILAVTLVWGYYAHAGDVSYGRLEKYPLPDPFAWYYILPPLILMIVTRIGIPLSTSFLILTFFNEKNLFGMITKSMMGYVVAFTAAIVLYILITKKLESRFIKNPITSKEKRMWTIFQWASTGFLWSQWLIQDFANIYVYLPRKIDLPTLIVSLLVILGLLAYIMATRGGNIQKIVKSKTNTVDIRSATIIDLLYGIVLLIFKEWSKIPMSTTWVFIGVLAGREIAINYMMGGVEARKFMFKNILSDLVKVFIGLVISVVLVYVVKGIANGF